MNEFYIEIEVGDARPESFLSSFLSSFLAVLSAAYVCVFLIVIVAPLLRVFLRGDGDSSSTFVGDLYSCSALADPSIQAKVLSLKSNLIISLISLASS